VAYENVEDAARNGLHYVELRFSPRYMAMTHQLPVDGVVEAVIAGVREGSRDFNVETRLIGILSRTFGEAACQQELDALLAHRDASPPWIWRVMSSASRAICLCNTLRGSRCRLAYYRARRRSGRAGKHLAGYTGAGS
jgi:hypothetical protein